VHTARRLPLNQQRRIAQHRIGRTAQGNAEQFHALPDTGEAEEVLCLDAGADRILADMAVPPGS